MKTQKRLVKPLYFKIIFVMIFLSGIMAEKHLYAGEEKSNKTGKTRMTESELAKKREGTYFAAFPGPGSSPDLGFILAVAGGIFNNGKKTDPYFAYTPYKHSLMFALSWSTKNMSSFLADFDAPYFRNTAFRIRSRLWYMRNPIETYYGLGLQPLTTPEGRPFSNYKDYEKDLLLNENGHTDAYYNYFENEFLLWNLNVERDLFGGLCRIVGGIYTSKFWIRDYTGDEVPGKEDPEFDERTDAIQNETLLHSDYLAGKIIGYDGGWSNSLQLGFAYDTRDMETNPRKGMFHDVYFVWSDKAMGSDFDYTITTISTRYYVRPLPKWIDLIFATRLAYSIKGGDVPVFIMNYLPSTDKHQYGLGGETSLRGYRQSRFRGQHALLGNLEMRYVFTDFKVRGELMELMLVPFVDYGRVYDEVKKTTLKDMKMTYGTGLRLSMNQAFTLSFDFGFSEEEKGVFYMSFGTIF